MQTNTNKETTNKQLQINNYKQTTANNCKQLQTSTNNCKRLQTKTFKQPKQTNENKQ